MLILLKTCVLFVGLMFAFSFKILFSFNFLCDHRILHPLLHYIYFGLDFDSKTIDPWPINWLID